MCGNLLSIRQKTYDSIQAENLHPVVRLAMGMEPSVHVPCGTCGAFLPFDRPVAEAQPQMLVHKC